MGYVSRLAAQAALVPADFITGYMPEANGDYVKVYLYLLLNGSLDEEKAADALRLTEGDVRRALRYWEEKGVIGGTDGARMTEEKNKKENTKKSTKAADRDALRDRYMSTEGTEILARLSEDADFTELLFIAQKYRSKIMDEKETEVFAYLYDGLHLPTEVLDYLVAYAVEHDHNSIRYIEKLGCDWAKIGIRDVEAAKRRTKQFEEKAANAAARLSGSLSGKDLSQASGNGARDGAGLRHAGEKPSRTDYNELVMQELIEDLG